MKYVINKCHGGFSISDLAFEWLIENKGWTVMEWEEGHYKGPNADILKLQDFPWGKYDFFKNRRNLSLRSNPDLVECVETLKEKANGKFAKLEIVECPYPPDGNIEIYEHDGYEILQTIPEKF